MLSRTVLERVAFKLNHLMVKSGSLGKARREARCGVSGKRRNAADRPLFATRRAGRIDWFKPWDKVFDGQPASMAAGFAGAECNTCYNAVDRHVEGGRGDQAAIIYDSPITGSKRTFTYAELLREVEALAAVLRDLGVGKGDRVLIYMPMVPEAAIAMLACARLGAVHSVVFGGFAAHELATRIDDCQPKVIVAASCGIEPNRQVPYKPLLDAAISMAKHKPPIASSCSARHIPTIWSRAATPITRPPSGRIWKPARSRPASRSPPPIRSTSSTPPARPASPRASCATTAATWSR
jgi:hypothetical protein